MPYFWLSFCDPKKPKGTQFLGASIVEAPHFMLAAPAAWVESCNPGGEVEIHEILLEDLSPTEAEMIINNTNRLMSFEELQALGFKPVISSDLN